LTGAISRCFEKVVRYARLLPGPKSFPFALRSALA
jgi:hypothetical protein